MSTFFGGNSLASTKVVSIASMKILSTLARCECFAKNSSSKRLRLGNDILGLMWLRLFSRISSQSEPSFVKKCAATQHVATMGKTKQRRNESDSEGSVIGSVTTKLNKMKMNGTS